MLRTAKRLNGLVKGHGGLQHGEGLVELGSVLNVRLMSSGNDLKSALAEKIPEAQVGSVLVSCNLIHGKQWANKALNAMHG